MEDKIHVKLQKSLDAVKKMRRKIAHEFYTQVLSNGQHITNDEKKVFIL
jgi:hypothetical protein